MNRLKILIVVAVIIGTTFWLAVSGFEQGKAYYQTVDEVFKQKRHLHQNVRLRVAGRVRAGSIEKLPLNAISFELEHKGHVLKILYNGKIPPPDTFKEGVDAVAEGTFGTDGFFVADKMQAKCASKYEAEHAS